VNTYMPLSEALVRVDRVLHPWHAQQLEPTASLPESVESRLEVCEFWLRSQAMNGMQMAKLTADQALPVSVEAFRAFSEAVAVVCEDHGLLALPDYFRGEGVYTKAMSNELALVNETLGCTTSLSHTRRDIGVDQAEFTRRLDALAQDLAEIMPSLTRRLEKTVGQRLSLLASSRSAGRPPGTFGQIQTMVIDILVAADDAELPIPAIRSQLTRRGVKFSGRKVLFHPAKGKPQMLKWTTLRDQITKRLRQVGSDRLEGREK
jgi:hypothetical protein